MSASLIVAIGTLFLLRLGVPTANIVDPKLLAYASARAANSTSHERQRFMRAARLHSFTDGSIGEALRVEHVEPPDIEAPDDVIVRIAGAGVCRTDLHILEGLAIGAGPVPLPHILGHENAGFVEAVGSAVTTVAVGDAVLCYPFLTTGLAAAERSGHEHYVADRRTPGLTIDGGYAELLKINERAAVPLPAGTDPAPYAPLTDAGLAAYRACKRVATQLRPGDTVIIIGAGGLGHLGLQILGALCAARVVVVDPKPDARALATRLRADAVCASMADVTDSPAAIIDFVGSDETVSRALALLAPGGTLMLVGVGGKVDIPAQTLVESEITVAGSLVGTYAELVELTNLVVSDRIEIVITKYALDDVVMALTDLRDGRVLGRAVLVP